MAIYLTTCIYIELKTIFADSAQKENNFIKIVSLTMFCKNFSLFLIKNAYTVTTRIKRNLLVTVAEIQLEKSYHKPLVHIFVVICTVNNDLP